MPATLQLDDFSLGADALRENDPDPHRLLLWARGPREGRVQFWQRIAGELPDQGFGAEMVATIPVRVTMFRQRIHGDLRKLFLRFWGQRNGSAPRYILPTGEWVEPLDNSREDALLLWAPDAGEVAGPAFIQEHWPAHESWKQLGPNLFLVLGVNPAPVSAPPDQTNEKEAVFLKKAPLGSSGETPDGSEPEEEFRRFRKEVDTLQQQGFWPQALEQAHHMLRWIREQWGEDHPLVLTGLNQLGWLYHLQGDQATAERFYRQALALDCPGGGQDHPNHATSMNNLALLCQARGGRDEAEALHRRALGIRLTRLGQGHPLVAVTLNNLALLYQAAAEPGPAGQMFARALDILRGTLGEAHPDFALALENLVRWLRATGQDLLADQLAEQALGCRLAADGLELSRVSDSLNILARWEDMPAASAAAPPAPVHGAEIPDVGSASQVVLNFPDLEGDVWKGTVTGDVRLETDERERYSVTARLDDGLATVASAPVFAAIDLPASEQPLLDVLEKAAPDEAPVPKGEMAELIEELENTPFEETAGDMLDELAETPSAESETAREDDQAAVLPVLAERPLIESAELPPDPPAPQFRVPCLAEEPIDHNIPRGDLPDFQAREEEWAAAIHERNDNAAAAVGLEGEEKKDSSGDPEPQLPNGTGLVCDFEAESDIPWAEEVGPEEAPTATSSGPLRNNDWDLEIEETEEDVHGPEQAALAESPESASAILPHATSEAVAPELPDESLLTGDTRSIEGPIEMVAAAATPVEHHGFSTSQVGAAGPASPLWEVDSSVPAPNLPETPGVVPGAAEPEPAEDDLLIPALPEDSEGVHEEMVAARETVEGVSPGIAMHEVDAHEPEDMVEQPPDLAKQSPDALELLEQGLARADRAASSQGRGSPEVQSELALLLSLACSKLADSSQAARVALDAVLRHKQIGMPSQASSEGDQEQHLELINRHEVARALPAGSAVIELVRQPIFHFQADSPSREDRWGPAHYLAFVLPAEDPDGVSLIDLGEAGSIDQRVADFLACLTGDGQGDGAGRPLRPGSRCHRDFLTAGIRLRQLIFDPIADALEGRTRLFLVPAGKLACLPFEVLPANEELHVLDTFSISYLLSGRELLCFQSRAGGQPGLPVVAADPDFNYFGEDLPMLRARRIAPRVRPFRGEEEPAGLAPLLGTRRCAVAVANLLGVEPWLAKAVRKERFQALHSPQILHLATHCCIRAKGNPGCALPARAGASVEEDQRDPALPETTLGLALAGANLRHPEGDAPAEDNFLGIADVADLDLAATALVVLPGSSPGRNDISVAAAVGLRHAFWRAGAATLVTSLWKVADWYVKELLLDFYDRLLAGESRAEALREAQLCLKARHPHQPACWGAFICQGDPGPLPEPAELGKAG